MTVALSYGLTFLAVKLGGGTGSKSFEATKGPPSTTHFALLCLFTTTHAFFASVFYAVALRGAARFGHLAAAPGQHAVRLAGKAAGCFVYGQMAFWYGIPTAVLVSESFTPAPLLAVIHVFFSPSGTRLWRFIAYGSAFFSLLLLLVMTRSLDPRTPMWFVAAAVGYQVALLRLQGAVVAKFFLSTDAGGEPPAGAPEKLS